MCLFNLSFHGWQTTAADKASRDQIRPNTSKFSAVVVALLSVLGGQLLKAHLFASAAKEPRIAQILLMW